MKIPFVTLSKEEKGLFKGSKKGHGIRLTPYSTRQHLTIGRINTELTVITIDETSIAYVRVDREQLENEISLDENYSAVPVKRHVLESAKRILDENLVTDKKEIREWKKRAKKIERIMPGVRVRRNSPRISKEMRELQKENERLKRQINNSSGIVMEMMMTGILPMIEPPPFPMNAVTQMRYGCDYLSYEWKEGVLHLHWVEVNLERSGKYPTLTQNEQLFRKAILSGNVVNHYHHTWVDGEGRQYWDSID
ncbi:hypothetical protein N9M83_03330 [Candidatus Poseidonia alphae]|nr:hypothetical protein [Candidatus Poseidonia alphae]